MEEKSTHLLFNNQGIYISPDIQPVFDFLMDIEKEIEVFLGFNKKLEGIRDDYLEMMNFASCLSAKLKENGLDCQFEFKEHPKNIAEKLKLNFPLRSQMIVLFVSLDVLFNLHTAYEFETSDEDRLRELTMDVNKIKDFLNSFILTERNPYYKENILRLSKIDSTKLRNLRNSLTHFFSIGHGGLSLAPDLMNDQSRKFENILKQNKNGHIFFISEQDLYGLIKEANVLRMRKWSEDFESDSGDFKGKMKCVIDLVEKEGPISFSGEHLNF